MNTFISLLRGINVSGHNLIKMDLLSKLYEDLGFLNPKTYLQSGNVVFQSEESNLILLASMITNKIKTEMGYDVPVIVLTIDCLKKVVEENPFLTDPSKDSGFMHVTFLASKLLNFDLEEIISKKTIDEDIVVRDDAVFLYCPHGYGKTKLNNGFLEKKLKVTATTRNWKSTNELLKLAILAQT